MSGTELVLAMTYVLDEMVTSLPLRICNPVGEYRHRNVKLQLVSRARMCSMRGIQLGLESAKISEWKLSR